MSILKSKPFTPGRRHYKYLPNFLLCKQTQLLKKFTFKIKRCVGRSVSSGHITLWGRSTGCKRLYRQLNYSTDTSLGIILFSFYDPNRTSFVSVFFDFLKYRFSYVLAITGVVAGSIFSSSLVLTDFFLGYRSLLNKHITGSLLSAISLPAKAYPQYALSAGTYCQLLQKGSHSCRIRLPSNKILTLSANCFGSLGTISNISHNLIVLGKAGRNRLLGYRPKVRGIAMNPVDHPHGGRANGGMAWRTPWGKPTHNCSTKTLRHKKVFKI